MAGLVYLLLSLLAATAPVWADGGTVARIISNVATIQWDVGNVVMRQTSNRVDITVQTDGQSQLSFYNIEGSLNSTARPSLAGAACEKNGTEIPFTFSGARSDVPINAVPTIQSGSIRLGEPLLFSVQRPDANKDPNSVDRLSATIAIQQDSEELILVETGPDTSVFMGIIATRATPPAAVSGDCSLSLSPGAMTEVHTSDDKDNEPFANARLNVLIDPYGIAFDSVDGRPISGTRVTILDAATGLPAEVFGDDGISHYPSTVVTGQSVTDSGGQVYNFPAGEYRFPLMRPGRYRLVLEPPSPYSAPSERKPEDMVRILRPDGVPVTVVPASYGAELLLDHPAPVRVDIPLDRPGNPIVLTKTASQSLAEAGDMIRYEVTIQNSDTRITGEVTVTDLIPPEMRLRADTVRLDGAAVVATVSADGGTLKVTVPSMAGGSSKRLTYVLEVKPNAKAGDTVNRVSAVDSIGTKSNIADAVVRITRESIADRMTILGRVIDGDCAADPEKSPGLPGLRVMLEDGSYAVTDEDGRYHFEGVLPGTHVVQIDDLSLPADRAAVDCAPSSRSAGRAFSRFVEGQGGALKRADFRVTHVAPREGGSKAKAPARPAPASDAAAAGAERDWFAGQQPGISWLFPEPDFNPRAPVVRVAIKHAPDQTVALYNDGKPVAKVAFDGTRKSPDGNFAISLWRGVPIAGKGVSSTLTAEVRDAKGVLVQTLERKVHYSDSPMNAVLLRDKSNLVADGVTRPVIALRLTDRQGHPIHHGVVGDFEVPPPYYPAMEADAQQARQLAGLERGRPVWRVEGDEGIAYVELEPTTASGSLSLRFKFREGDTEREQRVEAWLTPGDRPWTLVGLAEGTMGFNTLKGRMEDLGNGKDNDLLTDGRLALYAKGRISGKWLMTLAYDSDKKEAETRFGGVIDPTAYYTIYADRSERRYDAASVRKLYLRLERPQFYALFGDYETGIDEPKLARYVRSLNGAKAEYRSEQVSASAFAADTPMHHRRDEIQGNGLTGPYVLGARDIRANSERISIEVRDRTRSDRIVSTRLLARHIDYDIDYRAGTLRFREPILSRTSDLDPQFIVADYEVDGVGDRTVNAGGRVSYRTADQKVQVSATAIHDEDQAGRTNLAGADIRYRPNLSTEIRGEVAVSDNEGKNGSGKGGTAMAWQIEAEHHGPRVDILAYAREQEGGFGIGQLNAAENGTRKLGVDAHARITDTLSFTASGWHETYLSTDARRIAGRALLEYRHADIDARAGIVFADDRLGDGRTATSQLLQLGATKRLFDNKLELDAQTELPLGGKNDSIDFPAQHRFGARYALSTDVQLIGAYEIADGEYVDARTARIGFDVKPWSGARIALTGNFQDIAEYGPRSFAAYGLSQSLILDDHWSVDLSLDGNRTLRGFDPARIINPEHPVASGGFLGSGGLTEDFTAVTGGATYRADRWTITGRAEYRAGADDRYGFTAAALRQIGEGRALGGAFNWFHAKADGGGAETQTANLQLSWANRPAGSAFSWLDKLELREDSVTGALGGVRGPFGIPFSVVGDAKSRRIINNLSVNWSPGAVDAATWLNRAEVSLFWGSRYVADTFGDDDIAGWSNILGADFRFDISDKVDIGAAATIRQGVGGQSYSYAGGPSLGISPFENGWLSLGWNVIGFYDRDFTDDRYTRVGPYVTMRLKFDQATLQGLGLVN